MRIAEGRHLARDLHQREPVVTATPLRWDHQHRRDERPYLAQHHPDQYLTRCRRRRHVNDVGMMNVP
jgi:hypothetical protein